jgi:hypothetical protein
MIHRGVSKTIIEVVSMYHKQNEIVARLSLKIYLCSIEHSNNVASSIYRMEKYSRRTFCLPQTSADHAIHARENAMAPRHKVLNEQFFISTFPNTCPNGWHCNKAIRLHSNALDASAGAIKAAPGYSRVAVDASLQKTEHPPMVDVFAVPETAAVDTRKLLQRAVAHRDKPFDFYRCSSFIFLLAISCALSVRGQAAEIKPVGVDLSTFPGPDNTGVPRGTILTPYEGPCEITEPNTVIDARTVGCPLVIKASGVRITRSKTSWIDVDTTGASLTIEDSLVDGGKWHGPAIGFSNVTVRRSDVRGGQSSIQCSPNCLVEDSWLHAQYLQPGQPQHINGFLSNGWGDVTLRHNTIVCDVEDDNEGGCSGDAQIYGDFATLARFTFERNLFLPTPGGFCTSFGHNPGKPFGSNPTFIVVIGNVWVRGKNGSCASYGPTTSFDPNGEGNVWRENVWDDGSILRER